MEWEVAEEGLLRFGRHESLSGEVLFAGQIPLHNVGYECDTCGGLFSLVEPIPKPLAAEQISGLLASTIDDITIDLLESLSPLLPKGSYRVGLLQCIPRLRQSPSNSSLTEMEYQSYSFLGRSLAIEMIGICQRFSEDEPLPDPTKEEIYIELLEEDEVILPHRNYATLDWSRVSHYISVLHGGVTPTAVALSIGEGRHPQGKYESKRLTHFLIDGHHKMFAAATSFKPIHILSFFSVTNTRVPLEAMRVRHPMEYSGKRMNPRQAVDLWAKRQRGEEL